MRMQAVHLRIDTVEQGLRDLCGVPVTSEGYRLCYRIAADNLRVGMSVIADSCNPLELTRREWEQVAKDAGSRFVNIEVIGSDAGEHRRRIETRTSTVPGLKLPTWTDVENREYHVWKSDRIVIDTARRSETDCFDEMWLALERGLDTE